MTFLRYALALILVTASAGAQELSTAVVPIVGSVFGAGSTRWKTDVEIINDTAFPADVAVELPSAADSPAILLTLGPGQVQRFSDVVGEAFGIDGVLSPLRVTTGGRRSVTVRASAYATYRGEVSPRQPIAVFFGDTYYPVRILDGLAFSDAFRTNVGLVNFGELAADFLLALQRVPGRNLAVAQVRVEAGALVHVAIQSLFPLITKGHGFSIVTETGARGTYVYASVVDNETHAGTFVSPRVGAR